MDPNEFQAEIDKRNAENQAQQEKVNQTAAVNKAGIKTVQAVNANTKSTADGLKAVKDGVKITNPDLAKSDDIGAAVDAIHKLNLTTFNTNQGLPQLADNLVKLSEAIQTLQKGYETKGIASLSKQLSGLVGQLDAVSKTLTGAKVGVDSGLQKTIEGLNQSIDKIEFNPTVTVTAPKVTVPKLDTSGMERILADFTATQETEKIDLDEYYAQDLDQMEPGIQYVGFLNPKGEWYIIKNIEAENALRYAFGNDSYDLFWPKASQLDYKRLDEALNAA